MTFLPIVERELRVMARQRSAYWMRIGAVAGALTLAALVLLANWYEKGPKQSEAIFGATGFACLLFAMLTGMFLTSDCLSEERREGTLGLLFLTDLKGHDVVLGKLVSSSILSFFSLLAVLPVLALPLLMGGISGGEFWRMALVLVVTIFFSLSTAMLVSALNQDSRMAMLGALLVMIVLAGLLPLLWWLQHLVLRVPKLDFLLWACPFFTSDRALHGSYSTASGPAEFWFSTATLFGVGLVSLVSASVLLPRVWQERPAAKAANGRGTGRSARQPSAAAREAARRALRTERPFYWLATHAGPMKKRAQVSLGALLSIWLVCVVGAAVSWRGKGDFVGIAIYMGYGFHLVYKCLMAVEASRRFGEDRQSGALELLLTTSLSPSEIIRDQKQAVWASFRWLRRLLVGVNLLFVCLAASVKDNSGFHLYSFFCVMLIGGLVLLYFDTFALTRAGMWAALTAKRPSRAVLSALRRVMLLPWLASLPMPWILAMIFISSEGKLAIVWGLWIGLGVVVDLVVGISAGSNLRRHFRAAAAGVHSRRGLTAAVRSALARKPVTA